MISRKPFIYSQGIGFEVDFFNFSFSVSLKIIIGLGKCQILPHKVGLHCVLWTIHFWRVETFFLCVLENARQL